MKTLIWKELRENLSLGLVGLFIFTSLLVLGYRDCTAPSALTTPVYDSRSVIVQPLLASFLLRDTAIFCGAFGGILGWLQIYRERHRDLFAYLVHRPISRTRILGGKLIAGDSTKLRAQNSKKNNYNQAKIDRHVAYIDNKLEEYNRSLAENDGDNQQIIQDEIKKQQQRKDNYRNIEKQLKESGEAQISLSDPESRQIMIRNNITEVAYNVQTTVDSKNNLPIDYKVTNLNDSKAMGNMVQRAKSILRTNEFTALYDKGFHTGSELKTAQDLGVETIVAIPAVPSTSQAPNHDYNYEHFSYDKEADTYTCPQGQVLRTNGSWYKEYTSSGNIILFRQYKTKACKLCQAHSQCTRSKTARLIHRSEYADYYEKNRRNTLEKEHLYKRRQAIVEHPYGTLKRQWGFSYILTKKGISRASSDVGFMFIAYNLRRIGNILTLDLLKEYLRILISLFLCKTDLYRLKFSHFTPTFLRLSVWNSKFTGLLIPA